MLRRLVAGFLGLCVVFTVVVVGWGVVALTREHAPRETDLSRAERLAGLNHEQHPGKGRYYVAEDAVLARAPDGTTTGYLHYRLGGGVDVNVDDFLRTYDLPRPGGPAPLPEDLKAALPGDEPAEAALLPGDPGSSGHRQIWVVQSPAGLDGAGDVYVRATG
ncbi:hypothetical protein ACFVHB_02760 [Kitasatospora sp. NPDC127111]|uniref:hypothetical protein n=1 Tax=Kitasatospora sp. NPDC127111 TaxID=3345363 RepID=UPI0036326FE2